jgi:hypothetical protein
MHNKDVCTTHQLYMCHFGTLEFIQVSIPLRDRLCGLVVRVPVYRSKGPEVRVRFPALPNFLRSTGSGTGATQPREYNWGPTWKKNSCSDGSRDPSRWPRATPYQQKIGTNFVNKRQSVGRHSSSSGLRQRSCFLSKPLSRSQWSRCLRDELSSSAQMLEP